MDADRWAGLELRHLLALDAVAREGSFGRAAIALGYTQSAVSQQIAALERIVGARLVERPGGPRPVSLTEAGELLLRHAEAIVARLSAAQAHLAQLADGAAGVLRVGIYQSVGARVLPELMRRFSAAWPLVEIQLTESANDSDLLAAVKRVEASLRDPLRFVFRSDQNGTVQGLVAAGVGAALLPRLAVDPADDGVVRIDLDGRVPPRLISVVLHRDRYRSPAARAFVDTALEVCAEIGSDG